VSASSPKKPGPMPAVIVYAFAGGGDETDFVSTLSEDDRTRAARLVMPEKRAQFLRSRAVLRILLAHHTGLDPARIAIHRAAAGKPFIEGDVRFNLSHSREVTAVALAWGCEVGIDVEWIREDPPLDRLAERILAASELSSYRATDPSQKAEVFFRFWTRKEAYVKGRGAGLRIALRSFAVDLESDGPVVSDDGERWHVQTFWPRPGYVGAVAARGVSSREQVQVRPISTDALTALWRRMT